MLSDSSSLDSSPTPGTSMPVSQGMRGTSFLHTLTKHHASNSLLIVSMIMLSDSSSLDSSPTLGTSTPVSQGTRGMSFLHTLTKHHTSNSLLIVLMIMLSDSSSLDSLPTPGTSMPVSQGTRGTSSPHAPTHCLSCHHWILHPHQELPHLSPRGQGGWVSSTCSPNVMPLTHCLSYQW